jgi:transcriptional regulator with XRE-family HTH domain
MSLGRKLANYRKLAGFTQQQLGEALNLSPQAISKWENDLAEPDLATLRALSELYKIPIG